MMIEAPGATLEDFHWTARPLIVFADSPNDPRFVQQMEYIARDWERLAERDVIVVIDTDPAARSAIREELRPRGFMLVLIGKDGLKYLRKPLPWDVREISRSIDKMPLRQQELKDMRGRRMPLRRPLAVRDGGAAEPAPRARRAAPGCQPIRRCAIRTP